MNKEQLVSDIFDLPFESAPNIPKITIIGRGKIVVCDFVSLEEYKREDIKLKCKSYIIDISGSEFEIKKIREDCIYISGNLDKIQII